MENKEVVLIRLKNPSIGAAHYLIGEILTEKERDSHNEIEQIGYDLFAIKNVCQIRELLMSNRDAQGNVNQVIDYLMQPDNLTTEGVLFIDSTEITSYRYVGATEVLFKQYDSILKQFNLQKAGLVGASPDLNNVQNLRGN